MTETERETLLVERSDGVVTVTLNRPERKNAANARMWQELGEVFEEVDQSDTDRVLVVTGAGEAFCAGADLTGAADGAHPLMRMRRIGEVALRLHTMAKPTIAKINGDAVGAGLNLALGCDLSVAARGARFSEIFVKRGLSIDFGGSWLLPRLVGLHKAKELVLFGDLLSAPEALELGLVNRVVEPGELDEAVGSWAMRLAAGPPVALAQSKALLNEAMNATFPQALEGEARAQVVNMGTADVVEGFQAFRERREPRFTGRSLLGS